MEYDGHVTFYATPSARGEIDGRKSRGSAILVLNFSIVQSETTIVISYWLASQRRRIFTEATGELHEKQQIDDSSIAMSTRQVPIAARHRDRDPRQIHV